MKSAADKFKKGLAKSIVVLAGVGISGIAFAQSADREGTWETRVGVTIDNSSSWDFEGGSEAEIDSDVGFLLGFGYHYTDNLEFGGTFEFGSQDYTANIASGTLPGVVFSVDGELETMRVMLDGTYNFMTGRFSPFVTGSIGYTWIDTNIATQPPQTGCWWDPWWGYICTTYQNTKTVDGFTYRVGVGVRYDFNDQFAMHAAYRMTWIDLDNANSTPDQDGFLISVGWKF